MEEERQDQIQHENKLLYRKMTAILRKGAGNISPMRKNLSNSKSVRGSYSVYPGEHDIEAEFQVPHRSFN